MDATPVSSQPVCGNCRVPVAARARSGNRGPDCAWFAQCIDCAQIVANQLELVLDRPDDNFIQIFRCRWCGLERACRPGWATRCHICHDQRTAIIHLHNFTSLYQQLTASQGESAIAVESDLRTFALLHDDDPLDELDVADFIAALTAVGEVEDRGQTGWTMLAVDLHGWPWDVSGSGSWSHGTWARHDRCGKTQKLDPDGGRTECRHCPPTAGSRTFRSKASDRHLLYLVRYGGLQKFGHGTPARVRAHLREGAVAIQVIEAAHTDVVVAEAALKRRHRNRVLLGAHRMPTTFGAGTEVLSVDIPVDLRDLLTGRDVSERFWTPESGHAVAP